MQFRPQTPQQRAALTIIDPAASIFREMARLRFGDAMSPSPWLTLADFRHAALAARRHDPIIDRVPQIGRQRSKGDPS